MGISRVNAFIKFPVVGNQFSIFGNYNVKSVNMFGDLMGMMGKLKETQAKVEATKERLNTIFLTEISGDGLLEVEITANRALRSVSIDDRLMQDREQLQKQLLLTLNKAIARATDVHDSELAAVAKEGMPNIPGMDALFRK
jgi:DNA-binding YbaB/EbfC family protein